MKIKKMTEKPETKIGRPFKWPWLKLNKGESFEVKPKRGDTLQALVQRLRVSAANAASDGNTYKVSSDTENKIAICWREE